MSDFATPAMPTALLRHDLPDGTHHYDWLLARDWNGPLLTFRVGREISLDCKPFEAELLGDHRRAYLEYEGEISGGRGRVVRVSTGLADIQTESDSEVRLVLEMGLRRGLWIGRRVRSQVFHFESQNFGQI